MPVKNCMIFIFIQGILNDPKSINFELKYFPMGKLTNIKLNNPIGSKQYTNRIQCILEFSPLKCF